MISQLGVSKNCFTDTNQFQVSALILNIWAANMLGGESKALIPLKGAAPGNPITGIVSMYGQRMSIWRDVCLGKDTQWIELFSTDESIPVSPANTEWL